MAVRYAQLEDLVDEVKPARIVEVGVHTGRRSVLMCTRALLHVPEVHFVGYDVFDTMTDEFQLEALNGKGATSFDRFKNTMDTRLPSTGRVSWEVIIGNTRETLHPFQIEADFAFIDGDHRAEVIAGDFAAIRGAARMVVFDDYFRPDFKDRLPDLDVYGANKIVDALPKSMVEILPRSDQSRYGGVSHLAVVRLK